MNFRKVLTTIMLIIITISCFSAHILLGIIALIVSLIGGWLIFSVMESDQIRYNMRKRNDPGP